mgnify:CR=1 FL=1
MKVRMWVWLFLLGMASVAAFAYAQVATSFDAPSLWRIGLFPLIGLAGVLSVFLFPGFRQKRNVVLAIWIPSIVLRVLLLPTAVSDDVNRYLFEGKLVRSDINPYVQTADVEALKSYRDVYWRAMNHKDKPTAYPPLAELTFAAIGGVSYHPLAYKIVFVLADLLTLGAVLQLLRRRGLSLSYSGLYALNPIVLLAYAGEAHFDSLMVAALMWALCAHQAGRRQLAVALVSVATGIKWITLPLVPFFVGKRLVSGAVVALVVLLLPAMCFRDSLVELFHALFAFGGTRSFNGLVYDLLLRGVNIPRPACSGTVMALFALVILWRWLWRDRASLECHLRWILGALIVLSPTVHFWYLAWILPLVCLRPSLPWITFSFTGGVYFFVWMNAQEGRGWSLELWQQSLFWGPFVIACLYELWSTRGRVVLPLLRSADSAAPEVCVVIPTLNAAADLPRALASIKRQTVPDGEVIVVDAGSSDETVQIASAAALTGRVLSSARGRGLQIAAGLEAAKADWVVVLHADAELAPNAIECLLRAVEGNREVIGGAMGQRFAAGNPELLPIELLNDLRALFTRTAFGDQVQFFHRETTLSCQLMPKQALMEDVESSWRTREQGGFLFLGQPCLVSHRKWEPKDWLKRFKLVMRLVSKYRLARMRGGLHAEELSEKLYTEYYSVRK